MQETETGTVSGTVFYNDGTTPLAGAEVQVVAEGETEPVQGTITDDAGNFSMILNSGVYSLNVIVNGSSVGTLNVTINAGDSVPANVVTSRTVSR